MRRRGPWEKSVVERDYPVLRWLAILAREDGTTQVTPHALAQYLGWERELDEDIAHKRVNRAILALCDAKIITSDKSLKLNEQRAFNLKRKRTPELVWHDSPTLTIAENFRANQPPRALGKPIRPRRRSGKNDRARVGDSDPTVALRG